MVTGAPLPPQTSTIAELADRLRIICSVYDPLTGRYRTNYALYFEIVGFISFLFFLGWIVWNFTQKYRSDRIQSG
jgi:protein SCO1/2